MITLQSEDVDFVTECLGREPRGLRAIAARSRNGRPAVIRVASIVDEKPFPTLFWLVDPEVSLRIDREEAGGTIASLQQRVIDDSALKSAMTHDHEAHIALRESFLSDEEREYLQSRGQWSALASRGIGGIADFTRIRCLHTWYAAHLVTPNSVGTLLDERWERGDQPGSPEGS